MSSHWHKLNKKHQPNSLSTIFITYPRSSRITIECEKCIHHSQVVDRFSQAAAALNADNELTSFKKKIFIINSTKLFISMIDTFDFIFVIKIHTIYFCLKNTKWMWAWMTKQFAMLMRRHVRLQRGIYIFFYVYVVNYDIELIQYILSNFYCR